MAWKNIPLPAEQVEQVAARVAGDPTYTSVAAFVRAAVAEKLKRA